MEVIWEWECDEKHHHEHHIYVTLIKQLHFSIFITSPKVSFVLFVLLRIIKLLRFKTIFEKSDPLNINLMSVSVTYWAH